MPGQSRDTSGSPRARRHAGALNMSAEKDILRRIGVRLGMETFLVLKVINRYMRISAIFYGWLKEVFDIFGRSN